MEQAGGVSRFLGLNIPLIRVLFKDNIRVGTKFNVMLNLEQIRFFLLSLFTLIVLMVILNLIGWCFAHLYMTNLHKCLDSINNQLLNMNLNGKRNSSSTSTSCNSTLSRCHCVQMENTINRCNCHLNDFRCYSCCVNDKNTNLNLMRETDPDEIKDVPTAMYFQKDNDASMV